MFQRIQSLFLIIAAGLIASLFFTPMWSFIDGVVMHYYEYSPALIIILVTFVLSIVALFSFKKRIFQIRICNLNSLILVGFQIFLAVKFFQRADGMIYSVTALFPIIAAIFTFIAMRYVARDQAMVLASSRLRTKRKK